MILFVMLISFKLSYIVARIKYVCDGYNQSKNNN
jgi:hypothetical protein